MKRHSSRLDALEQRLTPREPVFYTRTPEDNAAWLRAMITLREAFLAGIPGVFVASGETPAEQAHDPVIAELDELIARGSPLQDERKTQ